MPRLRLPYLPIGPCPAGPMYHDWDYGNSFRYCSTCKRMEDRDGRLLVLPRRVA